VDQNVAVVAARVEAGERIAGRLGVERDIESAAVAAADVGLRGDLDRSPGERAVGAAGAQAVDLDGAAAGNHRFAIDVEGIRGVADVDGGLSGNVAVAVGLQAHIDVARDQRTGFGLRDVQPVGGQ